MFFHAVRCVDECERLIGVEKCAERFSVSEFTPAVRALNLDKIAGALFSVLCRSRGEVCTVHAFDAELASCSSRQDV